VVFDGHLNPLSNGIPHQVAGITVVFSRFGADADSVIESLARSARERGDETVVVTSDAQTQWVVLGGLVVRMSSPEFVGELRDQEDEWREHAPAGSMRGRLEDRVDADTRERLSRWARGDA
jgi:predicted RNA-binding protein with PIN domain